MTRNWIITLCGCLFLLLILSGCDFLSEAENEPKPTLQAEEQFAEKLHPTVTGEVEVISTPFNPQSTPLLTFTEAHFPELGLSLAHPPNWLAEQGNDFVVLLSSNAVFQQETGALLEITPVPRSKFDLYSRAKSTEDLMRMELERWIFLSPSSKLEVVQRANTMQLGDLEVATAIIHLKETTFPPGQEVIPSNEFDIQTGYRSPLQASRLQTVRVWIAVVPIDQQVVLFYGVSPLEVGEEFQTEFESIVQTVMLTEPLTNSIEG